jgi:hypothetical protein
MMNNTLFPQGGQTVGISPPGDSIDMSLDPLNISNTMDFDPSWMNAENMDWVCATPSLRRAEDVANIGIAVPRYFSGAESRCRTGQWQPTDIHGKDAN